MIPRGSERYFDPLFGKSQIYTGSEYTIYGDKLFQPPEGLTSDELKAFSTVLFGFDTDPTTKAIFSTSAPKTEADIDERMKKWETFLGGQLFPHMSEQKKKGAKAIIVMLIPDPEKVHADNLVAAKALKSRANSLFRGLKAITTVPADFYLAMVDTSETGIEEFGFNSRTEKITWDGKDLYDGKTWTGDAKALIAQFSSGAK